MNAPRLVPTIDLPVTPPGWTTDKGTDHRFHWTPPELQVIRERYIRSGLHACQRLLPARGRSAILNKARGLDLRRQKPHVRGGPSTPAIDAAIRAHYQEGGKRKRGAQAALAKRIARPRHWILDRARALGILTIEKKAPDWTAPEIAILEAAAEDGARAIQRRLRKAGYQRSIGGILTRCQILKITLRDNPDRYNIHQVAQWMGVEDRTVKRWISRGRLPAKREHTDGPLAQWIILRRDLRKFMIESPLEWEARRCDHLWLVDLLAGRLGLSVAQVQEAA